MNARSFLAYVPTAVTFLSLGGMAYWGHSHEWKAPKFAALFGGAAKTEKEDWCEKHGVPDSECLACHPEKAGGDPKDWCKEHGVPESKCPICHPDLAAKVAAADWCEKHGLPMSQCTICKPGTAVPSGRPAPTQVPPGVTTDPHAKPNADPRTCLTHLFRVQFASPEAMRKAGIQTTAAQERPVAEYVTAPATVSYDQTRLARLATRVPGTVWRLEKRVGDLVQKGEVLALVDAAEVGRAKAELLQAVTQLEARAKTLEAMKPVAASLPERQLRDAETAWRESGIRVFNAQQALMNLGLPLHSNEKAALSVEQLSQRIRFLGLPPAMARELEGETTTANLIPVTAPFDGTVLSCSAVAGEVVDSAKVQFVLADVRRVWIMLDLRAEDAALVKPGQPMTYFPDVPGQEPVLGKVSWISTEADEKTRTVHARAEVANPLGRLRANSFGRGQVQVRSRGKAIVVPDEAIQWEGCCHVVFVQQSEIVFQTRKVKPGVRQEGYTEIQVGLMEGEVVASTGSHVLKSEILKHRIGGADE